MPDQESRLEPTHAQHRIDGGSSDRLRLLARDLLDVDAALRRDHGDVALLGSIERDRGVQLVGDVREPLDQHPSHRRPAEALPEDPRGRRLRLLGRAREDDPAALAAPADLNLRLDRDLSAQPLGDRTSLGWSFGHPPFGEGDPVRREEILPLMLVQIQPVSSPSW